ncbi:MAG: histone deacetylase [bacterium]
MKIFFSPKSLEYNYPGHPESSARIKIIKDYLEEKKYSFIQPAPCKEKDILRVHTKKHLEAVKTGAFIDLDTPSIPHIFDYAALSAGGAINALKSSLDGKISFSLLRPPGHHATRDRVMGFCYFNNLAIAIAWYLNKNPNKKIAILDIDVHHGNGTEDIFRNNQNTLYVSIHQYPLFPGTGRESGKNFINFPLPPGTGEDLYLYALKKSCEFILKFNPDLIGISIGFDTLNNDPISIFNLSPGSFKKIGSQIALLKKPMFMVMEGGYSKDIPICAYNFLISIEK